MHLKPCIHCPRIGGCKRRLAIGRALRSVNINGATFKCEEMLPDFPPGMRVDIRGTVEETGGENYWTERGIVMRHFVCSMTGKNGDASRIGLRFAMVWRESPSHGRKNPFAQRLDALRPTGEQVPVCGTCGLPDDVEEMPETTFHCTECEGGP